MPSYQFLPGDLSGMARADSRLFIDVSLTLDGNGGYTLFSEAYVIEAGERATIGDPTGLGMVLTTNAEGTYVDNGDGTVTTSPATKAAVEMEWDTYSAQMRDATGMNVDGESEGSFDSDAHPMILDFVPETVWTLGAGTITSYRDASAGGVFTVSFNLNNGNLDSMPDYQFLGGNLGFMMPGEARLYVDVTLTLDGSGNYILFSEAYVIEAGERATIGDPTGLGMVLTMNASGTYTENADGTYTTAVPAHAVFEMEWDTYSAQLRDALGINVDGETEGTFDSAANPAILDFVPETVWTVTDGAIITWARAGGGEEPAADSLVVTSYDGGTTITFYADGTYVFAFEAYGIEDPGTYTYDGTTLTITNANGDVVTAEGDPLTFHYVSAVNEQLAGDFTVNAADLAALLSGGSSGDSLVITSDDGGTTMTFYTDGTYVFAFEAYGIEDPGTYTYDGTTLTVTNANGDAVTAEGDPLTFHYVSAVNEQLAGDFTVNAADLAALLSGGGASSGKGLVVTSDDGGTTITFNADGTYRFFFEAYGLEDFGAYTYDGTTLTVTNANGDVVTAEGDPLKFHYVSAINEQLGGDYTVAAADLAAVAGDAATQLNVEASIKDQLAAARKEFAKATKEYEAVKAKLYDVIRGKSSLPESVLTEMADEAKEKMMAASEKVSELSREAEQNSGRAEEIRKDYQRILKWSELFDDSDIATKKMVAGYLIKRIDVYTDYRLHIEFNINFAQFELGLDIPNEYKGQQPA